MVKGDANLSQGLGLFIGVFLLSAAILSFEILASRVASIILIYNYAFMVVSLAVLGLGTGGIFVFYKYREKELNEPYAKLSFYSSLFAAVASLFIILITATQLIANRFLYFLILFTPFFFAGVVLSLAFRSFAEQSFKLYTADLTGAAFGALAALGMLDTLGGVNSVLLVSVLGAVASFCFLTGRRRALSALKTPALLTFFCLFLFLANIFAAFLGEVPVARDRRKDLYNSLIDPLYKAQISESRWSAFGRSDLVSYENDDSAMTLFIDGAAGAAMYKFNGDLEKPDKDKERLRMQFSGFFPFHFLKQYEKEDMLIIGPGGGREVLFALLSGVGNITGVEVNRDFVDIVKKYRDYNGGIYTDFKNVEIVVSEGRSFLRGSQQKYDIIMFTLPVTKSSRSLEGYALTENYLFTLEAIKDYFAHLTSEGRMIVVLHHPHEMLRFVVTALTALEEMGISNQDAMRHIYTLGREMNPVLVLKKTPFTFAEADVRHKVMHILGLDTPESSYLPYIKQETILHRHEAGAAHEMAMFNRALVALSAGAIKLRALPTTMSHDISVVSDDRPFFFKAELGLPAAISSLLWLVILVNVLAIAIPAIYRAGLKKMFKPLALFMLLGAGFMMVEISFFQKLTLYLGSPTISLAILLGSLLSGMGAGSFLGQKFYPDNNIYRLKVFSCAIFIAVLLLFFIQPLILNSLLAAGILIKGLICAAFLLALGFILGVPFPTAVNWLKQTGAEGIIAWMYGVNGTMSVLGSVVAVAVSLTLGFSAALLLGALCYLAIVFILFNS